MRSFKWIEWNLQKIAAHGLGPDEVERAFGRRIWVIWRYDREQGDVPDVFGDIPDVPIFVITAY